MPFAEEEEVDVMGVFLLPSIRDTGGGGERSERQSGC